MDIFKSASPEEVKERKKLAEIERFKEWCGRNEVVYIQDDKDNIISFDKNTIDNKDSIENTALILCSMHNFIEIVKLLISNGADVNAVNRYSNTALMFACYNKNIELAVMLMDSGANVNDVKFINKLVGR